MRINLLSYLYETVARVPEKTAVVDGDISVSFMELLRRSKALGSVLSQKAGDVIRRPIAVLLSKSIDSVTADIAILFSGNAYMNLDVKSPLQRIDGILRRIDPVLVITAHKYAEALQEIWPKDKTIDLDAVEWNAAQFDQDRIDQTLSALIDTDPACVINTSGSTGVPKGVVLNHRSFIDFTEWAREEAGVHEGEVMGCLSPIVFDIYSFELCMLMAWGCTMVLLQESLAAFPARLLQILEKRHVTFIFWVPTIMVNIANMRLLEDIKPASLKTVWFAGEVFPTKQFNQWRRHLPRATFVNLYGPIEITLDCTFYMVERELSDDEPIPIGRACKNTDILILNDQNQPCATNEEGELCVRGTSLAMGYYNDPEKTAAAFVQNPLNRAYPETIYRTGDMAYVNERGEIMFKGRRDTLIKHSGYRIELNEIEHVAVNKLALFKNCCAVYDEGKKEIILYYEADEQMARSQLHKALAEVLPRYMIPSDFRWMRQLPRNANGKIDRLGLRETLESGD